MMPEERFARLEQNHDILVQLLIETRELNERMEARTERLEALTERIEARTEGLEAQTESLQAQTRSLQSQTESLQAQTKSLKEQAKILIELASDHDERLDTQLTWINKLGEAQAVADANLAALTGSQVRMEASQRKVEEAMARLADAQAYSDRRFGEFVAHFQNRRDAEA